MAKRLLRLPQVEDRTPYKRSKIYKLISEGKFPKPVKLGNVSAWPEDEIDAWIAEQIGPRGEAANA